LVARRKELLEKTAEKCQEILNGQGKTLVLAKDLATENGCIEAVEETANNFGRENGNPICLGFY